MYLENHDHSSITWVAGGRKRWYRVQPYLIALFTCLGAVMLHNGQEFGQSEEVVEDDSHEPPSRRRIQPRSLHWDQSEDTIGRLLRDKCALLARVRREHSALRSNHFYPDVYDERWTHFSPDGYGLDIDKQVLIYHRWGEAGDSRLERFIIVLNFSEQDQYVDLPFPTNGIWQDLLSGAQVDVVSNRLGSYRMRGRAFLALAAFVSQIRRVDEFQPILDGALPIEPGGPTVREAAGVDDQGSANPLGASAGAASAHHAKIRKERRKYSAVGRR